MENGKLKMENEEWGIFIFTFPFSIFTLI